LKDIYTGQSRGFGFVTFKDEKVATNLVKKVTVTSINGRKVDIKKAEPKAGGNNNEVGRGSSGPMNAARAP